MDANLLFIVCLPAAALLVSGFWVWLKIQNRKIYRLREEIHKWELEYVKLQEELRWSREEASKNEERLRSSYTGCQDLLAQMQEKYLMLREEWAAGKEQITGLGRMKEEYSQWIEKLRTDFDSLVSRILKENTDSLNEHNRRAVGEMILPVKERLEAFDRKLAETYQNHLRDQVDLKSELKKLHDLNQTLGAEAGKLVQALKGDNKRLGSWGEIVLERVLETSGLEKGREYIIQESLRDEDGSLLRPDVIILLPDQKSLVIDSKVSLTAYDRYLTAEDEVSRRAAGKEYATAIRNHIQGLSSKNYASAEGIQSPDFVLMFLAVEPAMALAFSEDPELFRFGWDKQVVVVSPSTLLATLRTIAAVWKQEKQNRNALEIARMGASLHDKLAGLAAKLDVLASRIDGSRKACDEALMLLRNGRGNILLKAEKMRRLGAPVGKSLEITNFEEDEESEE